MSFLRILSSRSLTSATRRYASNAAAHTDAPLKKTASGPSTPLSSCLPDTKLEGANFLKGQAPVVSRPDEEYPEWLWTILQPKVYPDDGPGGKAERVKRRADNKQRIKDRNFMSTQ